MLRSLAARLSERPDVLAVCLGRDSQGLGIVVQRGTDVSVDCGQWLKTRLQAEGGKGGGRPDRAEGRLQTPVAVDEMAARFRDFKPSA